ncbi:MAG: 16S rRNA (adenine(1518)-N(6)/adenine(1519)-N(6))-dimethyltransferase [Rhodospirillaceae bacterium]|nr:16S rRNA (adenine(1518)-N(6)/adenine(1519)-N(6))-dimethyltransferase [Rhodospirillaceae bacterium]
MNNIKTKIFNLPPIAAVVERYDLTPNKSWGQNFIFDLNLTRKIARAANLSSNETIFEIGPGPGALTRALFIEGAGKIVAIERDKRAITALAELVAICNGKLELISDDALKVPIDKMGVLPRRIVANLPYNIATQLLLNWLLTPNAFKAITVMVQKEVAMRICAKPGSSNYGRLSIITQWLACPKMLFDIPPSAFHPKPKVTSTLLEVIPRAQPLFPAKRQILEKITAQAFGQRRKMLRSSLKKVGGDDLLLATNIDPTLRPENLSIQDFCRLAQAYKT